MIIQLNQHLFKTVLMKYYDPHKERILKAVVLDYISLSLPNKLDTECSPQYLWM